MTGLPSELYNRCRSAFLGCSEFKSDVSLRAIFVIDGLAPFRDRLPEATDKSDRVDKCLEFLLDNQASDGQPLLSLFLDALCSKYREGDALRDELSTLIEAVKSAFISSKPPLTRKQIDGTRPVQQTNRQMQRIGRIASDTRASPYLAHVEDDMEQFINEVVRYLMETKNPTNQEPQAVGCLWFVHHQEVWETSHFILSQLKDDLNTTLATDLETVMEASVSLQQLSIQASEVLELLEVVDEGLPPWKPRSYLQNDLKRIMELASATAGQLEAIADRISWGDSPGQPVKQVERNLVPLQQLMEDTLEWLNRIVGWFDGIGAIST